MLNVRHLVLGSRSTHHRNDSDRKVNCDFTGKQTFKEIFCKKVRPMCEYVWWIATTLRRIRTPSLAGVATVCMVDFHHVETYPATLTCWGCYRMYGGLPPR